MPHHNTYGEDIITLQDAKIVQKNFTVLSHVNLHIKRGTFCYLIGKTGSGKSSLLKVLYGHLPLKEGNGEVVGFDLQKLRASDIPNLRRRLGIVFQDFQLLTDRSVERNLRFVLEATGWKDKNLIDHHQQPEHFDYVYSNTSIPATCQMVYHFIEALGKEDLVNHHLLILADEPTGNLDPETSNDIMNLLKKVSVERNCAVLMATHDYHMIQNFPGEAIKCEDGGVKVMNTVELFE